MQPTANAKSGLPVGNSFFIGGNSSTVAQLSTVVPVEIDTPIIINRRACAVSSERCEGATKGLRITNSEDPYVLNFKF